MEIRRSFWHTKCFVAIGHNPNIITSFFSSFTTERYIHLHKTVWKKQKLGLSIRYVIYILCNFYIHFVTVLMTWFETKYIEQIGNVMSSKYMFSLQRFSGFYQSAHKKSIDSDLQLLTLHTLLHGVWNKRSGSLEFLALLKYPHGR